MFRFKQFAVTDDKSSMKVGTDAVLLGAWAWIPESEEARILDVGCGSGVISLMLAQRAPKARITGIDIHADSVEQACQNATESPFPNVLFQHENFSAYVHGPVECIVSNPPYHTESLLAPEAARAAARSESFLPFKLLIEHSSTLLKHNGHLQVIIPAQAESAFHALCSQHDFHLSRSTQVQTTPTKAAKRVLLDYVKGVATTPLRTTITLTDSTGLRSKTYSELCQAFYL